MVGVHYGSGIHGSGERVDFAIRTDSPEAATALAGHLGGRSPLLAVADNLRTRSAEVSVVQNEVRGFVRVADEEFDSWLTAVYARLSGDCEASGEQVAKVGSAR
jgi:hypothetical protein